MSYEDIMACILMVIITAFVACIAGLLVWKLYKQIKDCDND